MNEPNQASTRFIAALAANDVTQYEQILHPDMFLRMWRWDGAEAFRPRDRVVRRLQSEWAAWPDPTVELLSEAIDHNRVAIEFRIQATENGRYVEHNRSAFLTLSQGCIAAIDMYCAEPQPSARRKGWIAPVDLSADELNRLFDEYDYTFDFREWVPPHFSGTFSLRFMRGGSENAHPRSNKVSGARLSPEEADARVAEVIGYFRERGCGFQWLVGPLDKPSDLGERLERHGMVLAGQQALMVRIGLDTLDIPINREVEVEELDGTRAESIEAALQVTAACFGWTQSQLAERRADYFEIVRNSALRRETISYLARIHGTPVAHARLILRGGTAYLGGASTLPAYRRQKVYSTLSHRRLAEARKRGYHIAAIHAQPMARRVVERYGFTEHARIDVFAWMPVLDLTVIRSLVPDD